ncbi:hypothetical protein [Nonomuraea diastatica]|uniref:hypothetical protein n=1 Tax=Nonomuraea diastatica TaxID=1848329 RepID=UPI001FE94885|nr:hypothetical protein [Nonomuraea diastatica]
MSTDQFGLAEGDYIPDPDRDTTLLIDAFYDHLVATLLEYALPSDLTTAMRARQGGLEAANQHLIVDKPPRQIIASQGTETPHAESLRKTQAAPSYPSCSGLRQNADGGTGLGSSAESAGAGRGHFRERAPWLRVHSRKTCGPAVWFQLPGSPGSSAFGARRSDLDWHWGVSILKSQIEDLV